MHGLKPYELHLVWTYGNNFGKMHRAREFMYAYDPPAYYKDGLFLSVDLTPIQVGIAWLPGHLAPCFLLPALVMPHLQICLQL